LSLFRFEGRQKRAFFIILFSLLDFNLFVIIILKVKIVNTTITYYQIIENMAMENNIGEKYKEIPDKTRFVARGFCQKIRC